MLLCVTVDDDDPRVVREKLAYFLEGVARSNQLLMEQRRIPPLYESGVGYLVDPDSAERQHVLDCLEVLQAGAADCKSLAAYRLAELRHRAPTASAARAYEWLITWQNFRRDPLGVGLKPRGGVCRVYHVAISLPDGSSEDPSQLVPRLG